MAFYGPTDGNLHILRSPAPNGNLFAQFDVNGDNRVDREEYAKGAQGVNAERAARAAWQQMRAEEAALNQAHHGTFVQQASNLMAAGMQVIEAPPIRVDGTLALHGAAGAKGGAGTGGCGSGPGLHGAGGCGDAQSGGVDFTFGHVLGAGGGNAQGQGQGAGGIAAGGSVGGGQGGQPGVLPAGYQAQLAVNPGLPAYMATGMPVKQNTGPGAGTAGAAHGQSGQQQQQNHQHGLDTSASAWAALGLPPRDPSAPLGSLQNPIVHTDRKVVNLPEPLYPGGKRFFAGVSEMNAAFAATELCATQEPECALAPQPQIKCKKWYNTYLYRPEERSHAESQYLERFIQGPDGEWVDTVKAKRMLQHLQNHQRAQEEAKAHKEALLEAAKYADKFSAADPGGHGGLGGMGGMGGGTGFPGGGTSEGAFAGAVNAGGDLAFRPTQYFDAYSGERLMVCQDGSLLPMQEILAQAGVEQSLGGELMKEVRGFDYDNLRVPWPFGRPYRNKKVSNHAYEWFDRQNPYIPNDKAYEFVELPSIYIDKEEYYQSLRPGRRAADNHVEVPAAAPVQ